MAWGMSPCCSNSAEIVEEFSLGLDTRLPSVEASTLAIGNPSWEARRQAVHNLGLLGHDQMPEVTPVLCHYMLRDEHWRVRREAAQTLGMLGQDAVSLAYPALQEACKDADNLVRDAALKALTSNGQPMPPMHKRLPNAGADRAASPRAGEDRDGASVATPREQESPLEFMVTVNRSDGPIGLDVKLNDGPYLTVKKLNAGIFKDWNAAHPSSEIKEGDCIIEINGVRGGSQKNSQSLVNELMTATTLNTLIHRRQQGSGGSPTMSTAWRSTGSPFQASSTGSPGDIQRRL